MRCGSKARKKKNNNANRHWFYTLHFHFLFCIHCPLLLCAFRAPWRYYVSLRKLLLLLLPCGSRMNPVIFLDLFKFYARVPGAHRHIFVFFMLPQWFYASAHAIKPKQKYITARIKSSLLQWVRQTWITSNFTFSCRASMWKSLWPHYRQLILHHTKSG